MAQSKTPITPKAPLAVIAAATCLALVVFTAPLTTLEAMTADLGLSPAAQAWVMSAMPLGAACGLLTAGAFGDTTGRRRTFLGGLWLTCLSSVAAALAGSGLFLIVMRVLQGLGSAGIMACGLGLLGQLYDGVPRRRAAAIWASALGGGVAAGPILASLLLPLGGWTGVHWLSAAAAAALGLLALRPVPESPRSGARVDLAGSVLLTGGLASVLAALTELRVGSAATVVVLLVAGLALLGLFLRLERRIDNPILRVDLFRRPDFAGATFAAFASGAGVLALMSMVPTVLVIGMGIAPLTAALVLLAWSGTTVVAALGAGLLPESLSPRQRVILAISGCAVGQFLMLRASVEAEWHAVLPGLFVAGVSNGFLNASLGHEAVQTVPPERSAMGSAANNTARYLGSAMGIAMVSLLITGLEGPAFFAEWQKAVLASGSASLLAALVMLVTGRSGTD